LSFARDAATGTPCKWAAKIEKNNWKKARRGKEKRKLGKGSMRREEKGRVAGRGDQRRGLDNGS
jgi:hypothetical protein